MLTGELKNKIDRLWDIFWTGGLTNPLDVIEQMTYLMFIHDIEDKVPPLHQWRYLKELPAAQMYATVQEQVFPLIKNLHEDKHSAYSKYMGDAVFKIPTPHMLERIVTAMDDLYAKMEQLRAADTRGDVYEYLLSKLATAGVNGQFRTPRHIIRLMVELMRPTPTDTICDPACGTSGFLVEAGEFLKTHHRQDISSAQAHRKHFMSGMFHGYDMDRTMLRIGAMNMMAHGIEHPDIQYRDSLSEQNTDTECYSLLLANPPFKGSLNTDTVHKGLQKGRKTKKTELLFLSLFLRLLKVGGRCACIVPDGVLFGASAAHKAIRQTIVEDHCLQAVISMPSGVFRPYAGVSTAILIFTKTGHGGTENVWFYDMQADGYTLDDKRTPAASTDIPDIIARFHNLEAEITRHRTDVSFLVPKQEIASNDYELSINKYKKSQHTRVEYPPAAEILSDIRSIQVEIDRNLAELEDLLQEDMPE